jgi:hypothetical protein
MIYRKYIRYLISAFIGSILHIVLALIMWNMPIDTIVGRCDPYVPSNNYDHRDFYKTIRVFEPAGRKNEVIANIDGSFTVVNFSLAHRVFHCESGFPRLLSMEYEYLSDGTSVRYTNGFQLQANAYKSSDPYLFRKYVPTKINHLHLLIVALAWGLCPFLFHSILRSYRVKHELCGHCGYSHVSSVGNVCPECGTAW